MRARGGRTSTRSRAHRPGAAAGVPDTYVKVWVGKVHWVSEAGATLALQQVYGGAGPVRRVPESQILPPELSLVLDPKAADAFQRAMFGIIPNEVGGDDAVCEVRVHYSRELREATGELVMRNECPVVDARSQAPMLYGDVIDSRERRHACEAGEALASAQRLAVPALVSTSYLLSAAKACIDRLLLEDTACFSSTDEGPGCDVELYELRERIQTWQEGSDVGIQDAAKVASLLQDLKPFSLYWALHHRNTSACRQTFGNFRDRYLRMQLDGEEGLARERRSPEGGRTFS